MHMLHHLSLATTDLKRSSAFYDAALAPLGYRRVCSHDTFAGYGVKDNEDKFALKLITEGATIPSEGTHLAFSAPNRKAVDEFYAEAMKHGGTDNGGFGVHSEYGPNYYAAFVFDPDGYRIEAVICGPATLSED
jgi:catechol 2,3-dioxygenase-like lactoylglutathione lyase family enzyme